MINGTVNHKQCGCGSIYFHVLRYPKTYSESSKQLVVATKKPVRTYSRRA